MSPRTAAAAVARGAAATVHAPARPRTAPPPAPPRRRSGAATPARRRSRTTGVALPRYGFISILDRLLRGPAYIATIGILLVGIVFFNVDVLELNHGIARTDTRAGELKRQNAALTLRLAQLGSSERIQRVALQRGLVLPQPGDVRYLQARRDDAARALRVMTAPQSTSGAAAATSAAVSQQSAASTTPAAATVPAAATTPAPAATTTPAPTATTIPAATATPTPTATPAPATTTQAGAATAPAATP